MSVLQTSVQTPCRRFHYNVHLTASKFSYLIYYANNYFEVHSEGISQAGVKCLSWLLQLTLHFDRARGLTALIYLFPELSDQIQRAIQLEEERRRAQQEAERLEADRLAALQAKEDLERQTMDQIKSQEQLVRPVILRIRYTGMLLCPLGKAKPCSPGKNIVPWSSGASDSIVVALVSVMSNLLFVFNFLFSLYYNGVEHLGRFSVSSVLLLCLGFFVFFFLLRVLIVPALLFNRLQSLQSIQPRLHSLKRRKGVKRVRLKNGKSGWVFCVKVTLQFHIWAERTVVLSTVWLLWTCGDKHLYTCREGQTCNECAICLQNTFLPTSLQSPFRMEASIRPKNVLIILEPWKARGTSINDAFNPWCNVRKHCISWEGAANAATLQVPVLRSACCCSWLPGARVRRVE